MTVQYDCSTNNYKHLDEGYGFKVEWAAPNQAIRSFGTYACNMIGLDNNANTRIY